MARCEQIRPSLYRVIEQEAEPVEAMQVASHLSTCTACKILLARKRRLALMLEEGLDDRIPVGEEFVRSVMQTLPDGPPPGSSKAKRGLKLAAIGGLLFALGQAASARLPLGGLERPGFVLTGFDVPSGEGFQGLLQLLRWAVTVVQTIGSGVPAELVLPGAGLALVLAAAGALAFGLVGGSAIVALAAGSYLRSQRV